MATDRTPGRTPAVALLPALVALLLAGCTPSYGGTPDVGPTSRPSASASGAGTPAPTSGADGTTSPAEDPGRTHREVPVRSADLDALTVTEAVPPVDLTVPALDIALPVDPVGVQADGQMEIPPLAERAGWYRFGAAPGEPGTTVVAAHVDSVASAGLGPFARLKDLRSGDTVTVTSADGTTRSYAVVDVTVVAKPQVTWDDVFTRGTDERLVLVTCGGSFSRDTGRYTDNVIVTTVPSGG